VLKIDGVSDYLDVNMNGAILSEDRIYRYLLTRKLSFEKSICLFIMLNPSTADETKNDPTVTRCIGFAKHWGFGRLEVCNIFAYRATNPKELYDLEYPSQVIGPDNDIHLRHAIERADRVVCAWGNHGVLFNRGIFLREAITLQNRTQMVFKITQKGQPIHPLYQKADAELITWAS